MLPASHPHGNYVQNTMTQRCSPNPSPAPSFTPAPPAQVQFPTSLRTTVQTRLPPRPCFKALPHLHLRVLPDLQAEVEVEVIRLSDGTVALRADIVTDDAVVAYSQSASGSVLQCDSRVRHRHSGPTWSSRDLCIAALGETGAGDLSATRAA